MFLTSLPSQPASTFFFVIFLSLFLSVLSTKLWNGTQLIFKLPHSGQLESYLGCHLQFNHICLVFRLTFARGGGVVVCRPSLSQMGHPSVQEQGPRSSMKEWGKPLVSASCPTQKPCIYAHLTLAVGNDVILAHTHWLKTSWEKNNTSSPPSKANRPVGLFVKSRKTVMTCFRQQKWHFCKWKIILKGVGGVCRPYLICCTSSKEHTHRTWRGISYITLSLTRWLVT